MSRILISTKKFRKTTRIHLTHFESYKINVKAYSFALSKCQICTWVIKKMDQQLFII